MSARNRTAFTLIELLTVMAIIGLLIAMLVPPLSRAREMARRGLCLAHMRGIGQGCITYSFGANGHFPFVGDPDPGFNAIGDAWDWDGAAAKTFGGGAPPAVLPKSNTRHLWKLVMMQMGDPKTFVCPSDGEGGDPFNPAGLRPMDPTCSSISDIQNRSQFSYAFQYQGPALPDTGNTKRAGWNTTNKDDPKLVILADGSPAFRAINSEAIATVPAADHTFEFASQSSPSFLTGNQYWAALNSVTNIKWDPVSAKAVYTLANTEDMRHLNSQNHRGDGQNIVRLDGSGDFATDPWAGAYMDNIWTVQDPTQYKSPTPDPNLLLEGRMKGLFDGAVNTEAVLMKNWVVHEWSKTRYPDSFLVP